MGYLLILIAVWIAISIALGYRARERGRSFFDWCVLSLLISPLIAGILLFVLPRKEISETEQWADQVLTQVFVAAAIIAAIVAVLIYFWPGQWLS